MFQRGPFQRFSILALVLLAFLTLNLSAQAPAGWKARVDGSASAADPAHAPELKFTAMEKGFHVAGGPAATYWNPANTATGNFTAKATFTLMKPSAGASYYGLLFGGADLEAPAQAAIYFLVGQDGTYIIRHRVGETVTDVSPKSPFFAIRKPDAAGKSTNTLEVQVAPTAITYLVNGTVVDASPKLVGVTSKTDGVVGVRLDPQLDIQIDGLEIKK